MFLVSDWPITDPGGVEWPNNWCYVYFHALTTHVNGPDRWHWFTASFKSHHHCHMTINMTTCPTPKTSISNIRPFLNIGPISHKCTKIDRYWCESRISDILLLFPANGEDGCFIFLFSSPSYPWCFILSSPSGVPLHFVSK